MNSVFTIEQVAGSHQESSGACRHVVDQVVFVI